MIRCWVSLQEKSKTGNKNEIIFMSITKRQKKEESHRSPNFYPSHLKERIDIRRGILPRSEKTQKHNLTFKIY